MQLGTSPLRLIRNVVVCSCCGAKLAPEAAGGAVSASYRGPQLLRVVVTSDAGDELHECPEPTWREPEPADPGDF